HQVLPAGWLQTSPTHDLGRHVHLGQGASVKGQDFGDRPTALQWGSYAGNAQHTGISPFQSQSLDQIKWQTAVDQQPQIVDNDIFIHYGEPLFTHDNVMILPVKTQADGGFELQGRRGSDGKLLWTVKSDYVQPPHAWGLPFSPALTGNDRVYFPGAGGTIHYIDHANLPGAKTVHSLSYYGLANYTAHKSALDGTTFVDTPLTLGPDGGVYYGVQVTGTNPLNLHGGLARVAGFGAPAFASAASASGSLQMDKVAQNCAPALSNDGKIVYVTVNQTNFIGVGAGILASDYLLALDAETLKTVGKTQLIDPASGSFAQIPDISTATPTVGPDGDVYYGVLDPGNDNHDRGFLLHFNRTLAQSKTPGAFGWDDTASVVPASIVPSYHGSSKYLLMTKYNDYAGLGGTGVNKLAVLDPNATETDPISGATTMKEVLTIAGVTPDKEFPELPGAVREWCINTAAVDPYTDSILAGSEDGKLYRWNLASNTFSQVIKLTDGVGEAYTPTAVGPDGTVYAINNGTIFAVSSR
ncbi:MAG TPA: hypothetical protein VLI90_20275, partial [Tepidisphaeraceae bacterium]|nr:hypothetical protein [Tepidisphaeraceae bacterium]